MPRKHAAAIVAVALLTSAVAARSLPPAPAAVAVSTASTPTLTGMTVTPTSLAEGLATLKVTGSGYAAGALSATCPKGVTLKLGTTNLCATARRRTDDQLERLLLRLRNPNHATGTITVTATIVDPAVSASTTTRRTATLTLLGS